MTHPPGLAAVAFSEAADGDVRGDQMARAQFSKKVGAPQEWAWASQVHGAAVVEAFRGGAQGEADAIWTAVPGIALAVFTADCLGVVLQSANAVGVAHAGWRGAVAGVVSRLAGEMAEAGHGPDRATVGPGIGPCCFEVGQEVLEQFEVAEVATTTWGSPSVDLVAAVAGQLGKTVNFSTRDECTRHDDRYFSHRRDGTMMRQVALGWLP